MPSSGPGAWIAGQGGVGPWGGLGISESSSSGGPLAQGGTEASAAATGGSASSSVAAPLVAAARAPGLPALDSPAASAASSESGPGEVNPDILDLQQECDLAHGRFSAASVQIEHLRDSLRVVEVARGAAEEDVRAARDATADTQARAFGEF